MNASLLPHPDTASPPLRPSLLQRMKTWHRLSRFEQPEGLFVSAGRLATDGVFTEGRAPTLLAFHGFCGVPRELDLVMNAGRTLGLRVVAPLLPGHGRDPAALRPFRYADWFEAAQTAFLEARAHGPVILCGMSMGSILASELATHYPKDVAGLIVVSNALWLRRPFPGTLLEMVARLGVPDFGVPWLADQRSGRIYFVQPVHAAVSVAQAAKRVRAQLPAVQSPTLVLHACRDEVCPVENAWKYAESIGTRDSQVIIVPRATHMMTLEPQSQTVVPGLVSFLDRTSGQARDVASVNFA